MAGATIYLNLENTTNSYFSLVLYATQNDLPDPHPDGQELFDQITYTKSGNDFHVTIKRKLDYEKHTAFRFKDENQALLMAMNEVAKPPEPHTWKMKTILNFMQETQKCNSGTILKINVFVLLISLLFLI